MCNVSKVDDEWKHTKATHVFPLPNSDFFYIRKVTRKLWRLPCCYEIQSRAKAYNWTESAQPQLSSCAGQLSGRHQQRYLRKEDQQPCLQAKLLKFFPRAEPSHCRRRHCLTWPRREMSQSLDRAQPQRARHEVWMPASEALQQVATRIKLHFHGTCCSDCLTYDRDANKELRKQH